MSSTICPKCRYVRQSKDQAPEWQCPSCGVAYAKVASTASSAPKAVAAQKSRSWLPLVGVLVVAAMWFAAWQLLQKHGGIDGVAGRIASLRGKVTTPAADTAYTLEKVQALASSTRVDDITIFTIDSCPSCAEAKSWMGQYGFPYQECNVEHSASCASQMSSLGGVGVPTLLVRGHTMNDGFDSEQMLELLAAK